MSDTDSDSSGDLEMLGLPSIKNINEKVAEEDKTADADSAKDIPEGKANMLDRFRSKAKDLITKTEKIKHLHIANPKISKIEECDQAEGSAASCTSEIYDPRFNKEAIFDKGYKLLKKLGNGAYASVFLCEKVEDPEKKSILKISIGEERVPDTQHEFEILKDLDFYSIPKAEGIIIDHDCFFSIV